MGTSEDWLPRSGRGGQWKDHRKIINGILWILHTGAPWRDLPPCYGPWQTVYDRFNKWRKNGLWRRLAQHLQALLDQQGLIDWDLWLVDPTVVRAHRSAAGAT